MVQQKKMNLFGEWKDRTKRQFFKHLGRKGHSSVLTAQGIMWQLLRSTFGLTSNCVWHQQKWPHANISDQKVIFFSVLLLCSLLLCKDYREYLGRIFHEVSKCAVECPPKEEASQGF